MKKLIICAIAAAGFLFLTNGFADISIPMHLVAKKGVGKLIGTVDAKQTKYGLLLTPHLKDLSPGIHGFHIHSNPSCGDMGLAAGGHLDPEHTGKHLGPYNDHGHLGDLPVLVVKKNGTATLPVLAPKLSITDIMNHSLMIHEHGDNYSDQPKKLGGGGPRVACGVIRKT